MDKAVAFTRTEEVGRHAATSGHARQNLNSLQVLRGVAALAVVVYHTHLILGDSQYGSIDLFGPIAGKGWLGVNFFFVLSGFIIVYAHTADVGRPDRVLNYLWRRFVRLYPIYWLMLTAYIAAAFAGIGHPDFRVTAGDLGSAYLLLPLVPEPTLPLAVAWTLFYEVGFYALFAVAIVNRSVGIAAGLLWTVAILINSLVYGNTGYSPLNPWNIYFPVGILIFLAYTRTDRRWGLPLLILGLTGLIALIAGGHIPDRIVEMYERPAALIVLALPFAAILLGTTVLERGRVWNAPSALKLLGDASYAIYLVHSPAISLIAQIHYHFVPGVVPPVVLFFLAAAVATVAGVMVHTLLERPLLKALKTRSRRVQAELAQ